MQSTKDILKIRPQLHPLGKSRWISTWEDTHGDIGRAYPHRFGNREKLNFKGCKEGTLVEYPLKKSKKPWDGESPPGADRVVYLEGEDKKFCGCMTHTGAGGNNFVKCK